MLDKNHVVDVPNGAIVRSNRIVLWTVGKNYIAAKQYNEDVRRMIGKTLETDKSKMYPALRAHMWVRTALPPYAASFWALLRFFSFLGPLLGRGIVISEQTKRTCES